MNRKVLVIVGAVVLLLILGGGFFILSSKKNTATETPTTTDQTIQKLSPSDIDLQLTMSSDNKKVKVIVGNVTDITSLEYEITYDADIPASELAPGEEGGQVERGFSDEAKITSADKKYESKYFDLGSCSKNVCRYDTGVKEIKILMKVTKHDGKLYEVQDSVTI